MAFLSKYMSIGKCVSLDDKQIIPVQNNLALTPSKMAEFVDQGIPVSASQLNGDFFDGVSNPSWDVSIDLKRVVDLVVGLNRRRIRGQVVGVQHVDQRLGFGGVEVHEGVVVVDQQVFVAHGDLLTECPSSWCIRG